MARRWLLTSNSELRPLGIWNWTIPALRASLDDGRRITTCPNAGVCARFCYARVNTYRFSNVLAAHTRNLAMVVDDLAGWEAAMDDELSHRRYVGGWVRIHDAGDFFSDEYVEAWLRLARAHPDVTFYCYTREVSRFRRIVEQPGACPANFLYCYSLGGLEDHLVDLEVDRHADVFPSLDAAIAAGYSSQHADDRLCVTSPNHRVAVVVNNIPHLRARQGDETFASLERRRRAGSEPVD